MAEYSKKSLIDIVNNSYEVIKGIVTKDGATLNMGSNSKCRFTFNYDTDKNILQSGSLSVVYNIINDNSNIISRYNTNAKINITARYFKEIQGSGDTPDTYESGTYANYQVFPYYSNESDGYINTIIVETRPYPIQQLDIDIVNDNENSINISKLNIFKEQTVEKVAEEVVKESPMKYGTFIEPRSDDPLNPEVGRIWLRIDLEQA